jgi:hypothetical protein
MECIIEMNQTELLSPESIQEVYNNTDQHDLALRLQNLSDLNSIQNVILVEDDKVMNLDEGLSRIIKFYKRFVPFPTITHTLLSEKNKELASVG